LAIHPFQLDRNEPTLLYRGAADVRDPDADEVVRAQVEVIFHWLPSPRVRWVLLGSDDAVRLAPRDTDLELVLLHDPWLQPSDDTLGISRGFGSGTELSRFCVGAPDAKVDELRAYVLNLYSALRASSFTRAALHWDVGEWSIHLEEVDDAAEMAARLQETRLYAPTHLLTARRKDDSDFDRSAADRLIELLHPLLGFINGANVGLALPVGIHAGEAKWCELDVMRCGRGGFSFTWTDPMHFSVQSAEFVNKAAELSRDEYTWPVIERVIGMAVAVNHLDPVDVTLPIAQAALELLAQLVLVRRESWLDPGADLDAAGRIRLLLCWAGIPRFIPPQLANIAAFGAGRGLPLFDGPRAITLVRRDIIHPPKQSEWPAHEVQVDAWRLATTYVELCVLRLCGYQGDHATRYHLNGRWIGTVEAAPWAHGAAT
jgi:hypothetical protein